MRPMILAVSLCAVIAGCGPAAPGGGGDGPAAPDGVPKPTASYAGKYQMNAGDGTRATTIYADGAKLRMEGPPFAQVKASSVTVATVMDQASKKLVTFRLGRGAPKVAMVVDISRIGQAATLFEMDKDQPNAKPAGEDEVAGLACRVWETPAAKGEPADQVCITSDGIRLRINKAGEADKPFLVAMEIKRGQQDAALFVPPSDYEMVDFADCASMLSEAMAAARAGKQTDLAELQECSALGEKINTIYGE